MDAESGSLFARSHRTEKTAALAGARRLGYEFYVSGARVVSGSPTAAVSVHLQIRNTGIAPFYYNWPVQLRLLDGNRATVRTWDTGWKLSSLLPSETNTVWNFTLINPGLVPGSYKLLMAVRNPLTNGVPLRFANELQNADEAGWLTVGTVTVISSQP